MTVRSVPIFLQAGSHPAEETRLMLGGMLGTVTGSFAGGVAAADPAHGVVRPGDFAVTQNGTPNMSVNVAAGGAFIRGTQNANQGAYHVWNDGTVNLPISAADVTNGRRDLVIAQVRDSAYSGADDDARITVVTGTPAAVPADPSLASFPNALVLARITVVAGDTAINTADITNLRTVANQRGKIPTFNSQALASVAIPSPVDGQAYYHNTGTSSEGPLWWNGSAWRLPWSMPWGTVAIAEITSGTAGGASMVTVTGSNLNFTVIANRRYRYTVFGHYFFNSVNDGMRVSITDGVGNQVSEVNLLPVGIPNTAFATGFSFTGHETPASTLAITRQLRVGRFTGTSGNVTFFADANRKGLFIVEDIGPAGNPV